MKTAMHHGHNLPHALRNLGIVLLSVALFECGIGALAMLGGY